MTYSTDSIEGIIYTSYLTKYNITEITKSFNFGTIDEFSFDFIRRHNEVSVEKLTNAHIRNAYSDMKECMEMLRFYDVKPISIFSKSYPSKLKDIKNPPPILYVKGKLKNTKNLAVIGTREASEFASENVKKVVELFAEKKFGIVSGLALGIDSLAHKQALKINAYTISVLATPLNSIYPKENYGLAADILKNGGALISELPFAINRGKKSFVERNRIITGLSTYVMPIEMSITSGTMSAVNFCKSQKRTLLLQKPSESFSRLKQSEGISHLVDEFKTKALKNVIVLEQDYNWNNISKKHDISQSSLFS